jgi:hypothetical protein
MAGGNQSQIGTESAVGAGPTDGVVEIESQWTTRRRERLGIMPTARLHENPAQAKLERGTLKSSLEVKVGPAPRSSSRIARSGPGF